ncbi:hypothetical protein [Ligilactobacillus salivarius]|uniref:hypothetical protein n=1 Tax=Ligilactobacillus salivarius TaxID=1624 RepID=UPI00259B8801|nr:hypothetical protein [Ligilactobacillus salivarius]MDM8261877.1 hypothetical protein [Ligilactobacillus salivarius]
MKILSELFKIIAIITYITMIITVIVVPSDDNVYEYMFYELAIFLFSSYSKCLVDTKILERIIKEEMWRLEDRSNRSNK